MSCDSIDPEQLNENGTLKLHFWNLIFQINFELNWMKMIIFLTYLMQKCMFALKCTVVYILVKNSWMLSH